MNWSDEHYVKLYTRRTATRELWPWQARALHPNLMMVLDHAGMLSGGKDLVRSVAVLTGLPIDVVTPGLDAMLDDGTLEIVGGSLVMPKFNDAQEAKKANTQSKRESRERAKALARAEATAQPTELLTPPVIDGHRVSSMVIDGHPSAQPSPAQPVPSPLKEAAAATETFKVDKVAGPFVVEPPTTPAETWNADEFWRWAQSRRQASGYVAEKWPHPRKLSAWWSEARVVADVGRLREAFYAFGDDDYWGKQAPPYPFGGFMSQWGNFAPKQRKAAP